MNVYQMFTQVIAGLMLENIGTVMTHTDTLQIYTNTSANLATSWISNSEVGTPASNYLIGPPGPDGKCTGGINADTDPVQFGKDLANFFSLYLTGNGLYECSQAFGIVI